MTALDEKLATYTQVEAILSELKSMRTALDTHTAHRLADHERANRHGRRLGELERWRKEVERAASMKVPTPVAAWQPRPPARSGEWDPDDTGQNQIADLEKALEQQRAALAAEEARRLESLRWWPKLVKRDIPATVVKGIALALAVSLRTWLSTHVFH